MVCVDFVQENEALKIQRRKLTADKKQLAADVSEFERTKEQDKKKLEEEKKRLRRDRTLLEKSQKDKKSHVDKKSAEEIEDLQAKVLCTSSYLKKFTSIFFIFLKCLKYLPTFA